MQAGQQTCYTMLRRLAGQQFGVQQPSCMRMNGSTSNAPEGMAALIGKLGKGVFRR